MNRCVICDWPLAESQAKGCVPGDCSMRADRGWDREKMDKRRAMLKAVTAVVGDRALAERALRAMIDA